MLRTIKSIAILAIFALLSNSCNEFKNTNPSVDLTEADKTPVGVWKILRATRNGEVITDKMDFTQFRLLLNENGTYTIDDSLPFIVSENGTWSIDDPQYPFYIKFKENSAEEFMTASFNFPIVNGIRQLNLTFSAGCFRNLYSYTFIEESK